MGRSLTIAGVRLNVVHPGLYRMAGTEYWLTYDDGWWITHHCNPLHSKPYSSMVEAANHMRLAHHFFLEGSHGSDTH